MGTVTKLLREFPVFSAKKTFESTLLKLSILYEKKIIRLIRRKYAYDILGKMRNEMRSFKEMKCLMGISGIVDGNSNQSPTF